MGSSASRTPSSEAEELISSALGSHKVVIFSKQSCGYCDAAKRIFRQESLRLSNVGCNAPSPEVIELDDGSMDPRIAREIQIALGRMTGGNTVPRVFVEGEFVGGATETMRYAKSGGLRMALIRAGQCDVK